MKKITLIIVIALIGRFAFAQVEFDSANSVFKLIDAYKSVYDTSVLNTEGGIGQAVRNLEMIWAPRLFPDGDCREGANAIYNYSVNYLHETSGYDPEWTCLGPTGLPDGYSWDNYRGNGQMHRIVFAPNYDNTSCKTIYACSSFGGLWRTTNNGDHWTNVKTDLLPFAGVADMCINPSDTSQLFICTGYADGASVLTYDPNWFRINPLFTHGLFRSDDYGETWQPINNGFLDDFEDGGTCRRMIINPQNPDIIFIATTLGIYRTTNATETDPDDVIWSNVFTGMPGRRDFRGLAFHPDNPNIVYASGQNIYKSINGGNAWASMTGGTSGLVIDNLPNEFKVNRINITVTPAEGAEDFLYAYIEGKENVSGYRACLYIFVYNGSNWSQIEYRYYTSAQNNVADSWISIAVSPVNYKELCYGTTTVFGTTDFTTTTFVSWASYSSSEGFHPDVHDLIYQPVSSDPDLFAATHGGISVKDMPNIGTGNWASKYDGLQVATIWAFDDSEWDKDQFIIGNQDCGTNIITKNHNNWKRLSDGGGDGYGCRINDEDNTMAFLSLGQESFKGYNFLNNGAFNIYENGKRPVDPWDNVGQPPQRTRVPKLMPLCNNPLTNTMYFGFTEVWKQKLDWPVSNTIWTDLWEIDSDIHNAHDPELGGWQRQIIELVICESDTNTIYIVTGGQQNEPEVWQLESHLFKSTTGGINGVIPAPSNFKELDYPCVEGEHFPIITGIVVDPLNEDRIWICYTGYQDQYKVWYTDDGGEDIEEWENWDPNGTLNNLPVNAIAYQYGTPDRIYIGTDAGVYTRDSNTDWEKYGDCPNVRVTEMKINYCSNKLRIATFGRGVWEGDLVVYEDIYVKEINDDITLINNLALQGSMKINSGVTLTVKGTISVPAGHSIIVEPGGKLILNGGTLTNACGDTWQGIEVWGNPSLSQIPANQGWLVITNGGTIENAEVAVRAGSADYTGKGGGIVSAENAVFLNNTVSVMFDPYTAYTNTSAFGSCTFNYTKAISGEPELYFAKLNNVISVQFNYCTFTNNSNQDRIGVGIESINSIFSVEGLCTEYSGTECNDWDPGLFENLEYGVYATASTTTRFADISHTTFTDNSHGIYLGGMTLPRVTSNEFQLNRTAAQGGYGLYLDGSTQYWVEDNHFESSIAETPTGIGIYVNASGSLANEIYLNSFDYIEYAVTVLGYNRNSRTTTTGLQIRCNYYDNTLYDETIVHEGPFLPGSDGIASIQGNNTLIPVPTDMAGNIFYYNNSVSGDFDDLNNQSNHFFYYYSNNAGINHVEPLDYTASTVTKQPKTTTPWTYENGCPSNLTTGGGGGTEESRASMNEALSDIESTETVLLALVDGGDTESLKTEVETSTPPETAEIYNELMTGSPYLSETVVGTAIDKEEVLPNSMVRDVMVANPHTSTSLQLLDKLDDRNNPMPAWMKAQILAGRSIQSLKTELESQLAGYQMAKCRAMNSLARHFGQQPENPAITDSLIALYQSDNTLSSRYMQAWLYLYSGQYQQGHNVMASIPANFTLAEDELTEYQNIQWLYAMLKGLLESGNGLDGLSEAQIAQLHAIVADETDFASVYARNMLLAIDELEYQEPIILPNSMKSTEVEEAYHEVLNSQAPTILEVYPNPSKDFIILAYQFDKETKGMIEIRDISGKPVQSIPFNGMQDQVTVTTSGWTAGVYILSLVVNDKVIETTKFTLVK